MCALFVVLSESFWHHLPPYGLGDRNKPCFSQPWSCHFRRDHMWTCVVLRGNGIIIAVALAKEASVENVRQNFREQCDACGSSCLLNERDDQLEWGYNDRYIFGR